MIVFILFDQKQCFPHVKQICKSYFERSENFVIFVIFGAQLLNDCARMRLKIIISEKTNIYLLKTKNESVLLF